MRYILLVIFCIFILTPLNTFARTHHSHPVGKTTLADTTEGDYDMKHIKFNLSFSDTSVYVSGDVTTTAQVIVSSMNNYVFELDTLMTIDSAKVNGQLMTVQTNGIVRTINLPIPLTQNAFFNAQIFYHGYSPTGSGFFTGLTHGVTSGGSNVVYSVSDPYAGSDWWPCKQSLDDKIDSVDMWVTVPARQVVGSNGLLKYIDSTSTPGYWQYQWKTRYAIDYYLISVAVGPYVIDSYRVLLPGATDSMLIQNFFLDTATFYPAYKANFDSIGLILQYYCSIYGTYPFNQEKYGMCYTTLPGGMEHQTMTTIGVPYTWVIAHELCHQWFGDHVTYAYWGDVWLSEGFARYSEQLYEEHFFGETAAHNYRLPQYNNAMSQPGGSVYVTDTSGPNTLFDQRLVYDKAAAVVHMLRFLAPADSVFFNVLKTYQQQYALGLATTEGLKNIAEAAYGMNLDTFFNQWIYGQGYPRYAVSWDQQGNTVYVKLVQTPSYPSSIPLFSTPLQVQLNSAAGDTVIRIYNNSLTQIYTFAWSDSVTSVKLEPNLWILCKVNTNVVHDPTLNTSNILPDDNIKAFPNPTANNWQVEHLPANTEIILTDMDGRVLWQKKAAGPTILVPGKHLATGNYLLKMKYTDNDTTTIKLTHW